jgi:hypothetical protein
MNNYKNIIKNTNNYNSLTLNKLNTKKNLKINNPISFPKNNLKNQNKENNSKVINKNYNKNYNDDLLKLSNQKQISIFLKALYFIKIKIKKVISPFGIKKNKNIFIKYITNTKKKKNKNKIIDNKKISINKKNNPDLLASPSFIPVIRTATKKISPYMFGDNKINLSILAKKVFGKYGNKNSINNINNFSLLDNKEKKLLHLEVPELYSNDTNRYTSSFKTSIKNKNINKEIKKFWKKNKNEQKKEQEVNNINNIIMNQLKKKFTTHNNNNNNNNINNNNNNNNNINNNNNNNKMVNIKTKSINSHHVTEDMKFLNIIVNNWKIKINKYSPHKYHILNDRSEVIQSQASVGSVGFVKEGRLDLVSLNKTTKFITSGQQDLLKNIKNKIGLAYKSKFKSKSIIPLKTVNSKTQKLISSTDQFVHKEIYDKEINKNFENYKLLIKINKNNNYKLINNIRDYINKITIFNSKTAAEHSISNIYNYNFNNSTSAPQAIKNLTNNLYTFLESFFLSIYCLISKPIYIITPDKVVIHLFICSFPFLKNLKNLEVYKVKFKSYNFTKKLDVNNLKLKKISQLLAHYFKKPVEFELTKLNYSFYNSEILVKHLSYFINYTNLRKIKYNLFEIANKQIFNNNKNSPIHSYLAGINIKVAGRLLTQRVIPRKTVKIFKTGKFARSKIIYLETARFTNKNKRGAFSVTVTTSYLK